MMLELQALLTEAEFDAELDYQQLGCVYGHTLEFEATKLSTPVKVLVQLGDDSLVKLYATHTNEFNKRWIESHAVTSVFTGKEKNMVDVFNSLTKHYNP
jgi:hypothetical protein